MASNSGGGGGGVGLPGGGMGMNTGGGLSSGERMGSMGSSGISSSIGLVGMMGSSTSSSSTKDHHHRDYEIKDQLDQAMSELNSVRVQYIDSKRRCDNAQEKLDYYIKQYTTTMGQLEMAHQDIGMLREKYTDASNEKIRLQQKVNHLEKKLARIIESMKLENGSSQTICAFLEHYNELKKKYEQNRGDFEKMAKETEAARKRCSEMMEDRNSLALEKDKLKHQLMMTTCQYNLVQRERDERVQALKQNNDDVIKELNHVLDTKLIELRRSTEQRNAAEQELSLILSEKDTVLKENQKLSDDLLMVVKKSNEMEQRLKEEKQALFYEQERMKRELDNALKFREDIAKECESLREKLHEAKSSSGSTSGSGSGVSGGHDTSKDSGDDHQRMTKSRSHESWSKELADTKEFNVEQHLRDLEAANRENDLLRKQLDKLQKEAMKATVDMELAKSRRDWAITEREKIVCERDSVKILCDELRKERDTAISDLLAAIRDSESIKKQKDEACKEIEQLREHLELSQGGGTGAGAVVGATGTTTTTTGTTVAPNTGNTALRWSCASAYDCLESLRKTDTEAVDIEITGLPTDGELGLVLDGGRDEHSMSGDDTGVYVVSIAKDSVCDGKLRPNDCVLKVNNLDCANVSRRIVLESIRSSAPRCQVVVRRQLMNAMHLYTTQLNLKSARSHGLTFESGMHIAKIEAGSLAARDKNLAVGDRIISVNKRTIDGLTNPSEVLMELDDNRNESAVIVALKQIGQMNTAQTRLMHNNKMVNSCTQTQEGGGERFYEETNKRMSTVGILSPLGGVSNVGNIGGNNASGTGHLIGGGFHVGATEAIAMSKSTGHGLSSPPQPSGSSSSAAKSTSKLTELLKIIRGKSHKYTSGGDNSPEDSQAQNEAISLLDSVLNSSDNGTSGGGGGKASVKRTKKKKEAKDSNGKSMGTWPRANIIAHENLSGTIVQKPKRERPTLSVFNSPPMSPMNSGGSSAGGGQQSIVSGQGDSGERHDDDHEVEVEDVEEERVRREKSSGKRESQFYDPEVVIMPKSTSGGQIPGQSSSSSSGFVPVLSAGVSSRKNTPVIQPPYLMNRHSVYGGTLDTSLSHSSSMMNPILMPKPLHSLPSGTSGGGGGGGPMTTQTLSRMRHNNATMMDYERQHLAAMNRMSLNFTPSDQSLFYGGDQSMGAKQKSGSGSGAQMGNTHYGSPLTPQPPFLDSNALKMSSCSGASSGAYKGLSSPIDLLPVVVKPPSRDSLDVYGGREKKFTRNEYMGSGGGVDGGGVGNTNTLPAYMRSTGGGNHMYTTNRNGGPKLLPSDPHVGSPMQSPITTQSTVDSTGMLATPPASAFDSYISPSYNHHHHHQTAASIDYHQFGHKHRYQQQNQNQSQHQQQLQGMRDEMVPSPYTVASGGYEGGTFPRKKENQRFRIPSNHSVTSRGSGVKNSTGSIEQQHGSDRGSPMPMFQVEVLSHGSNNTNKRNTMTEYYCLGQKPSPGDLRRVTIDKSVEPLGITIRCNNNGGGIFVATVTESSIASQVGLQTGDQLLEVCGLNMRSATYDLAASVLRQCGNTLTMLVQYNPDKYDVDLAHSTDDECVTQSGASTPQNSPGGEAHLRLSHQHQMMMTTTARPTAMASKSLGAMVTTKNHASNVVHPHRSVLFPATSPPPPSTVPTSPSILSTASSSVQASNQAKRESSGQQMSSGSGSSKSNMANNSYLVTTAAGVGGGGGGSGSGGSSLVPGNMSLMAEMNSLKSISATPSATNIYQDEPRILIIETKRKSLGISFVGGNKTGIFVHRVVPDSLGDSAGIRVGDQILEFNGIDLRVATAEQAYLEIAKPTEKVSVVVQHNMQKFTQIDPDQESIDSLYIKVAFDRTGELGESELKFAKDDVLYVDNTMFTGTPGLWRAWTLDEYGHRLQCGLIPSQTKVEEELRLHQDIPDSDTSRRATASARRSFFRRKKHQRSSSDSKELASFSNTQLSYFSDSGMLNDENAINSYIRMERLDYSNYRPILIIGPLAEFVVDKLNADFPSEFERCKLLPMNCPEETLEKNYNVYVDYRRRGSIFECTTLQAIKEVRDRKRHGCLDISITSVERLHRMQMYPIVLMLRFRSAKQIKEVKDSRYSTDKISAKAAKEMYEHSVKLESEFGHLISAIIPAGVNINHMSSQVKVAVEDEQKKVLWVPFSTMTSI